MRTIWIVRSAFAPLNPGVIDGDQEGRRENSNQDDDRNHQGENRCHRPRHAVRLTPLATRNERRINRNERSRKRAFSEQVLQEIGNLERLREGVGFIDSAQSSG